MKIHVTCIFQRIKTIKFQSIQKPYKLSFHPITFCQKVVLISIFGCSPVRDIPSPNAILNNDIKIFIIQPMAP